MFCLLVVLVKCSRGLLAKWLARKTPLKKPNRGEGIVSRKPRQKSAMIFLVYCIVSSFYYVFVLSPAPTWYIFLLLWRDICAESAVKPQANKLSHCGLSGNCLPQLAKNFAWADGHWAFYSTYQANICVGLQNLSLQMCFQESKWSNMRRRPGPRYRELTALPKPLNWT